MATQPPYKRLAGRNARTSVSDENRLRDLAERLDRISTDALTGLIAQRIGGMVEYEESRARRDEFLIRIISGAGNPYTSWEEVVDDGAGGFTPPGNGLAGSGTMEAREVNGGVVPVNMVCRAWLARDNISVDFVAPRISITTIGPDETLTIEGSSGHPAEVIFGSFSILVIPTTLVSPVTGSMYVDTTTNTLWIYNGTAWVSYGSDCWQRVARQITTSTVNDWSLDPAPWWVIDYNPGGGTCILYGIVAPTCNRDIWITNTGKDSGANNTILQFRHEDVTETTAARRFLTPDGQSFDLYPQRTALLRYDTVTARWRLFVVSSASATRSGLVSLAHQSMGSGEKDFDTSVGIGTTSVLSGTVFDARGSAIVGGTVYFTGNTFPASTNGAGFLSYAAKILNLQIAISDRAASYCYGLVVDAQNNRLANRHNGGTPKYSFFNDGTGLYTDGFTGTVTLAKITAGGANGSMTITGGIVTSYTAPT